MESPSKIEVLLQAPSANGGDFVDLLVGLAWPLAIVAIIIFLRQPLVEFFRNLGGRFTKVSVGAFAIELAGAAAQSRSIAALDDIRDVASNAPVADSSSALLQSLQKEGTANYAVVSIGNGDEWLTSRLYLASSIVPRMRFIKLIVFTASNGNRDMFLGAADVHEVRWKLAMLYPWLEVAYAQAYNEAIGPIDAKSSPINVSFNEHGRIQPYQSEALVRIFKSKIQVTNAPAYSSEWVELEGGIWERAHWVTPRWIEDHIQLSTAAVVRDLRSTEDEFSKQMLRAGEAFVPVVDEQRTFIRLVNRTGFVNRVVKQLADER